MYHVFKSYFPYHRLASRSWTELFQSCFIKKLISLIVRRRTKRGSTVGMIQYFFSIKKLNRYSNQVSESNYKFSLQNVRIINAVLLHSLVMISLYSTHFIFCKRKLGKTKTNTFPSNFPRKNACFPMF